ncbi:hypothetical protein B0T17DRAFT_461311, partial [Bombardia bombarda]
AAAATSTLFSRNYSSSFIQDEPAPPRLPAEQQAEFERLQRAAEAALHSHTQTPPSSPLATSRHVSTPSSSTSSTATATAAAAAAVAAETATATEGGAEEKTATQQFSGGIRKGAPPEFEGETNPKTGEVGGPKNEPLRWGSSGDWSFNGRVTDF